MFRCSSDCFAALAALHCVPVCLKSAQTHPIALMRLVLCTLIAGAATCDNALVVLMAMTGTRRGCH